MASPARSGVDEVGITPVRVAHRSTKAVFRLGHHNQMDMVRHQAIGPNLNTPLPRLLCQQILVDFVIAFLKEDGFAAVPTLRHMMGQYRHHDARETGHTSELIAGNSYRVPVFTDVNGSVGGVVSQALRAVIP